MTKKPKAADVLSAALAESTAAADTPSNSSS